MESTHMTIIMFSELLTGLITVRDSKTLADVMHLRAPNEAHTAWLISSVRLFRDTKLLKFRSITHHQEHPSKRNQKPKALSWQLNFLCCRS